MVGLVDFLKASGVEVNVDSLKIHLACWNGREHPIDFYYAGRFKEWQEDQRHRNFKCNHVIGLIDLGQSEWLFAGVYRILGSRSRGGDKVRYSTELLPRQKEMIGRIIVHHKRTRASYIWFKPGIVLPIVEIRRQKQTIQDFPGYNSVTVSHSDLKTIIGQKNESWHSALANIKGIYLITDTSSGKHYVGKASGNKGIWQRWCAYAKNGHGGNKELKALLKKRGGKHARHFQYSVLEIADTHATEDDILKRESYWMKALRSRKGGLN